MYQPLEQAFQRSFAQPSLEPFRIFHGRGHMHEGLDHINVDWYPPVLLIVGYQPITEIDELTELALASDKLGQISSIVYQQRSGKGAASACIWGEDHPKIVVAENGLKFEVQPGLHQNAGVFLDMRPLRAWLKANSENKSVLNLFAYTCSLSVAALAGNARQVVNVDMSKSSIDWGKRNHELNGQDSRAVRSIPHNIFRSWGRIQKSGPYDTVIIDPPTRQRGSFDAEKDYVTLLKRLGRLSKPGTEVIMTLNSPYLGLDYLPNLMARYQPTFRRLGEFPASPEFVDRFPERALKIFHFRAG